MEQPPSRRAILVRANNPSPMTLDGTNTWVLVEPGADRAVVVDPGPKDPSHLQAIVAAARDAGASRIVEILLTHRHSDHAEGVQALADLTGAQPRAHPPHDGELIDVAGLRVEAIATPGHTADSVCFVLAQDGALLTGDTVLGKGSTVVAHPDGRLADYLESLARLRSLVEQRPLFVVLPGHGPVREDPAALIDGYLRHRQERLDQVRAAIAVGARDADAVVQAVYGDVDEALGKAARWSVLAQLEYLQERGETAISPGG